MGSSYGFPVVDAVGRSIALSNGYRYPALCRVVRFLLPACWTSRRSCWIETRSWMNCVQSVTAAKMGRALKELLFQYNWKRVGLLYRPGPYSLAVTEGILNEVLIKEQRQQKCVKPHSIMMTLAQATLAGVDFISITLPEALTNETIDAALRQLEVHSRRVCANLASSQRFCGLVICRSGSCVCS